MADEYIKRSQAIKELTNAYEYEYPTASGAFDEFATTIVPNVLRNIPAADVVEVVHSKWIKRNNERRCPICDFFYMTNGTTVYNLCPMCGAKMSGSDTNLPINNGWISVEDRLPENESLCLIVTTVYFTPDHTDDPDHYDSFEISAFHPDHGFISENGLNVKFWQPLPEPPKGSD